MSGNKVNKYVNALKDENPSMRNRVIRAAINQKKLTNNESNLIIHGLLSHNKSMEKNKTILNVYKELVSLTKNDRVRLLNRYYKNSVINIKQKIYLEKRLKKFDVKRKIKRVKPVKKIYDDLKNKSKKLSIKDINKNIKGHILGYGLNQEKLNEVARMIQQYRRNRVKNDYEKLVKNKSMTENDKKRGQVILNNMKIQNYATKQNAIINYLSKNSSMNYKNLVNELRYFGILNLRDFNNSLTYLKIQVNTKKRGNRINAFSNQ
jgi:hypothetical protein